MPANFLQWFRKIHLYLGVFTAPAILFFAFTGVLQTLGLQDAARDGSYRPPHWIAVLAQVHKKQTAQVPQRKPGPPAASAFDTQHSGKATVKPVAALPEQPSAPPRHNAWPLKVFFLVVCASLFASTFSGIYLSWKYRRSRVMMTALILAGIVLPLLMLEF